MRQIKMLGYIINAEGLSPDPAKVRAVQFIPRPQNATQVRAYLGLIGFYRKFIRNFSIIAQILHYLTKKNQVFQWTKECEEAFESLKEKLITAPILSSKSKSKLTSTFVYRRQRNRRSGYVMPRR